MHLSQHHFQARDRYFEDSTKLAFSSLFYAPYGWSGLKLDREALLNGAVAIRDGRGVMPDGLAFAFPEDTPPPALSIREAFSETADSHLVMLTIPAYKEDGSNCGTTGGTGSSRFIAEDTPIRDATTGRDEERVKVARKNFQLTLDTGVDADKIALPVAKILRAGSDAFTYDEAYVAPSLQIAASPGLLALLKRLRDLLEGKATSMAAERRGAGQQSDFGQNEIARYWLSHALHSNLPILRHQLEMKSTHPEQVYSHLLRLGGALCTFALDSDPTRLPLYDHESLADCFGNLEQHIRVHLDASLPKGATRIGLGPMPAEAVEAQLADVMKDAQPQEIATKATSTGWQYQSGSVSDPRSYQDSHWFLEVSDSGGGQTMISKIESLTKICASKFIVRLAHSSVSGLEIEHASVVPAELSPRVGAEYFRIRLPLDPTTPSGRCWKWIVESGEVGVYTHPELSSLTFEILIATES